MTLRAAGQGEQPGASDTGAPDTGATKAGATEASTTEASTAEAATQERGRAHLVLVGFMGSGKSAVGRRAAAALGLPFIDTDSLIEERAGAPVRAIFESTGEAAFRDMESLLVAEAAAGPPSVIATGGGALLRPESVAALRQRGILIHLAVDAPTVLKRCGDRADRPLIAGHDDPLARIEDLMAAREAVYAQADARIDAAAGSIGEVARAAIAAWRRLGGDSARPKERCAGDAG